MVSLSDRVGSDDGLAAIARATERREELGTRVSLVVSVDTEEDNWYRARSDITVENIREVPRFHAFLGTMGIRPTYFTTFQVASTPWAAELLRGVLEGGNAELGAHLHPWNTPPMEEQFTPTNSMLKNLSAPLQAAKLTSLTQVLERSFGTRPTAFRAGRFGVSATVIQILASQGYTVDSSVTPWVSWEHHDDGARFEGAPVVPYEVDGAHEVTQRVPGAIMIEAPVTSGYTRWPFPSWGRVYRLLASPAVRGLHAVGLAARIGFLDRVILSPEVATAKEMLRLSRTLIAHGVRYLHLFLHSPSLRPGLSPFARTVAERDQLYERIARYADGLSAIATVECPTVSEAALVRALMFSSQGEITS